MQIQTVAGYTVWKSFMFLIIVGAVWGLLTGTRLLRGEEDAGRWELLLAGQTTRRRAAGQALAGLGAGLAVLWTLTAAITVVVGRTSKVHIAAGPALFFAVALVAAAALFLAAGALASQLAATRRQAAIYAGAALGVAYALRMVADSGTGLAWLRWTTPLGWVEELQPLTAARPLALAADRRARRRARRLGGVPGGRRDLGASILPDRTSAPARTRLLSGPAGLTVRLMRPVVLGWAAAIAAMALLMGFIAKQGGRVADELVERRAGDRPARARRRRGRRLPRVRVRDRGRVGGLRRRRSGHRCSGRGGRRSPRPPARPAGVPLVLAGAAGWRSPRRS